MLVVGKASRRKGKVRENYRFICLSHEAPYRGVVRFDHEEARKDWNTHNFSAHAGKRTTMNREEAIALLLTQSIDGAPTGVLRWSLTGKGETT